MVDALWAWLDAEQLSPMRACERLFGRDGQNRVKGSAFVYQVLHGRYLPGEAKIAELAAKGVDLRPAVEAALRLAQAQGGTTPVAASQGRRPRRRSAPAREPPSARAALVAYTAAHGSAQGNAAASALAPPSPSPLPAPPAMFALTIDGDGTARLSLNLVGISAHDALRCVAALRTIGLIKVPVGD